MHIQEHYPLEVYYYKGRLYDYNNLRQAMDRDRVDDLTQVVKAYQNRDGTFYYDSPVTQKRHVFDTQGALEQRIAKDYSVRLHEINGDYVRRNPNRPKVIHRSQPDPHFETHYHSEKNLNNEDWLDQTIYVLVVLFSIFVILTSVFMFLQVILRL